MPAQKPPAAPRRSQRPRLSPPTAQQQATRGRARPARPAPSPTLPPLFDARFPPPSPLRTLPQQPVAPVRRPRPDADIAPRDPVISGEPARKRTTTAPPTTSTSASTSSTLPKQPVASSRMGRANGDMAPPQLPRTQSNLGPPSTRGQQTASGQRKVVDVDMMAPELPGSDASTGGQRRTRDSDVGAADETNIRVVVRCRGRSEREVRENSSIVVATDGVNGNSVELVMGPNAVSNKTYHFDKAFSASADQNMIYDDVVKPMLDEVSASAAARG